MVTEMVVERYMTPRERFLLIKEAIGAMGAQRPTLSAELEAIADVSNNRHPKLRSVMLLQEVVAEARRAQMSELSPIGEA